MSRPRPLPVPGPAGQPLERAYLDIETDWSQNITVVGIFRPGQGCRQWISPKISKDEIVEFLDGIQVLFTYNGSRFDLPVIRRQMQLDLEKRFLHRDLMYDCWAQSLYGGLKKVEIRLGIHRDTEGVDGIEAMRLWERFRRQTEMEALEVLLRYNREDVENLEALALKLGILIDAPKNIQANPEC